jgi:integrase
VDYLDILSRSATVTFAEVTELAYASNETEIRQSSAAARDSVYRNQLEPTFGSRPISDISSLEIEIWMLNLRSHISPFTHRPLARESIRVAYVRLATTLNFAERHGLIDVNPTRSVRSPRKTRAEVQYLDPHEVASLANKVDGHRPYGLIVRAAGLTGLRRGELAALRVRDVDIDAGHIEVRRTAQRRPGGWSYGPPKSSRGARDVPLVSTLREELKKFIGEHPYRNDSEAMLWPGLAQLNTGMRGESSFDRQIDLVHVQRYALQPASEALKLGNVTWGTLRHSYASMLAGAGVDIYKVSRWMGHSDVSITDRIYTHLFKSDHEKDMLAVDQYIDRSRPLA